MEPMDLVPFRNQWAGSETKLDLKAWYRRPAADGGFSVVGPLPLRRHLDWMRKGFEYVTLGTLDDVALVAPMLRAEGLDVEAMRKSYSKASPYGFLMAEYLKSERVKDADFVSEIQAKVDRYGAEAVVEMMRMQDPGFTLPAGVKVKEHAGKK